MPAVAARAERTFHLSGPQLEVFDSDARFRVLIAGRRFGKTYLACVELLRAAAARQMARVWYVAPTYFAAKDIAWRQLKGMIPDQLLAGKPNETELSIMLVNGSQIALRGAEKFERLRGPGLDFVVLDEFAQMDRDAWEAVLRPALADRGGGALFISTPYGHNWAYDLYLKGLRGEDDWQAWQYTTLDGGRVPESEVRASRQSMDPRLFRQEFEASFETLAGRVYSNFSRERYPRGNIDADVEDLGGEILVGQDFNVNPMASVIALRAGDECHVLDAIELPVSNTEEVAAELRRRYPGRRVVVCPDPSGRARKTSAPVGQTDFTILARAGFTVRAPSAAPPVVDRENNTQAMLLSGDGRRRLRIHPRAEALIRGLDGLTYKKDTNQRDKTLGLDHICDALDYLLWQEFNLLLERRAVGFKFRIA